MGRVILSQEVFEIKARAVHGDKYEYGEYVNSVTKMAITCPCHGIFHQRPNAHLSGGSICPTCAKYSQTKRMGSKPLSQDVFEIKARAVHGDKYEYGEYVNTATKMAITCPRHGIFHQRPNSHLSGGDGCPKCSGSTHLSQEVFEIKARAVHGDKYEYGEYVNTATKMAITCPHHGIFHQRPNSHLSGGSICPTCAINNSSLGLYNKNNPDYDPRRESFVYLASCSYKDPTTTEIEYFMKIGVSIHPSERMKQFQPYNAILIDTVKTDVEGAIIIEKQLHKLHAKNQYKPKHSFGGETECFNIDIDRL